MAFAVGSASMGVVALRRSADDPTPAPSAGCPFQQTLPVILDAIRHPVMRRWSHALLDADRGCWTVAQPVSGEMLADAITRAQPDVVIVDTVDFPACCHAALDALPPGHVVVIGPEPDLAYRSVAMAQGAAGWVSRDHVGDELGPAVRRALGCPYDVCPEQMAFPARRPGPFVAHVARDGGPSR